ncbi:MAG TPA: 50S ribosomal protein L11 methyltransferase [Thermoleophilaceae bacterium]|nr:50S ribosomal protein L11 methyltransferase [Thermoleophilaceae bacterium]
MIRLAFRAPAEQAEIALAALLELAPSGVEQVDGDGFTEFALYGAPGELPSFPEGEAEVGGVVVHVSGREVPDDWAERWKRFHRPVLIAGKIYVRPPWEDAAVRPGVTEIVIDPGQAFGTGTHPTTALCLELMLDVKPRGSFADLGCGSGVLSIAAAKLGFAPITAVDAERQAVEATRANALANGVSPEREASDPGSVFGRIPALGVELGDLRNQPAPKADFVAANLMRPLLLRVAELWAGEPPPTLIVSGLLEDEADEVAAAFAPLRERRRLTSLGWTALLLEAAESR